METDEKIRSHLRRTPADVPAFEPRVEHVLRRARTRRWRRYVIAGAAAALLVAGIGVPLAVLSGLRGPNQPGEEGTLSPAGLQPLRPRVTAEISINGWPTQVEPGAGAVWTVADATLARIDPMTNDVRAFPFGANDVAVGAGGVWVATHLGDQGQGIVRLDPDTGSEIATIPIEGELVSPVAADDDAVWVGIVESGQAAVARIDPVTNEVAASVPLTGFGLPEPKAIRGLAELAVGEGAVWVLVPEWLKGEIIGGFVVKVDPESERVVAAAPVGYSLWLDAGGGAVWAQSGQRRAVRIDPETVEVVGEPIEVEGGFAPFGVGEGGVWFITDLPGARSGAVSRLNPDTLEVDVSIPLETTPSWSAGLDTSTHTVWVGTEDSSLIRIDLR
jgi:hypothetical protein